MVLYHPRGLARCWPHASAMGEINTGPCPWLTIVAGQAEHLVVAYDGSGSGPENAVAGAAAILWGDR